jgi:hypothetical protein
VREPTPLHSKPQGCGYVVTSTGHRAALTSESCKCEPQWSGRILECALCGTVLGLWDERYLAGAGNR